MEMHDCPRLDRCSAAICPLDPGWRKRVHTVGDRVCAFMLEAAKATRDEVFIGEQGVDLLTACDKMRRELEKLRDTSPMGMPRGTRILLQTVEDSAETGSRVLSGRRLHGGDTVAERVDPPNTTGEPA